ncbi:MAG: NAD-dependent epimerase/dehydratase family protein [Lachnospiraceae bacterium]|jgi:nucleoside-diphosphate-sugar epimerase|nr:NAD-dependent epimerase/dehydratase family protein [Lachnospiraceae bacterium]
MKRILVTGMHSYLGNSFARFVSQWPEQYEVDFVDLKTDTWKEKDFGFFDSIYHVAGIAHRKETAENANEYFEINRDLSISVAKKAKAEGVKQFIFLSSGSVYGMESGIITKETPLNARTSYGKSKAEAEKELRKLEDKKFRVAILRPLMVYGKNCEGNFQEIIKIVKRSPVFPRVRNQRSLIYIDNLSSFVKMAIDKQLSGIYFPKNAEEVGTCEIAKGVAETLGKKIYMSWMLGGMVYLFRNMSGVMKKAFTNLTYSGTEEFDYSYCVIDTKESIRESV